MMKIIMKFVLSVVVVVGLLWGFVEFYPYIFSKNIDGEILSVERLLDPAMVISGRQMNQQIFSFAVAVKDHKTGEIFAASTEDRQWAALTPEVISRGICAKVEFFPYPFWKLDKAGTYFGARLLRPYECTKTSK